MVKLVLTKLIDVPGKGKSDVDGYSIENFRLSSMLFIKLKNPSTLLLSGKTQKMSSTYLTLQFWGNIPTHL